MNGGRGLREGATVEVTDAHLQQSPSPHFHQIVLSCCLRSTVRVRQFSRLCAALSPTSISGNLHLHLLFRYHLHLPEYLWVCEITKKLKEKFYPCMVKRRCLWGSFSSSGTPGLTEKLLSETLSSFSGLRCERDLQGEILKEPHECPLGQYSALPSPWTLPPLSLLPSPVSDSQYLQNEESNQSLHWTHHALSPKHLPSKPRLIGVLQASCSGYLALKDQTLSLPCLVVPRPSISWIGCVLEVGPYELVTERVQDTERDGRMSTMTYVVFHSSDVTVLHQSSGCPSCPRTPSVSPPPCKIAKLEGAWASRIFLLKRVEALVPVPGSKGTFQFQAQAIWLGTPQIFPSQTEIEDEEQRESWKEKYKSRSKVVLIFCNSAARWFHFMHPNRVYRMIATGEMDLEIFDRQPEDSLPRSSLPLCFRVPCEWTLQDVEVPGDLTCPLESPLSVDQALNDSCTGSLVSVTGVVSQRVLCDKQNMRKFPSIACTESFLPHGVSLKVTLTESSSHSVLSVYMNLSQSSYPIGLLPGSTVLLQGLERKVSRYGSVYLHSVPLTAVTVLGLPSKGSENLPIPKLGLFTQLLGPSIVQRVLCSITCVLSVTLNWDCSACGDVFKKGICNRCTSRSGVFHAKAWVKVEDGSGEANLQLHDNDVVTALGIQRGLWEALQGRVLSRGELMVQNRGRNYETSSEVRSEDALSCHVMHLISRPAVSRPLILTFKQLAGAAREQSNLRRFNRKERDYMTQVLPSLSLLCVRLEEVEPQALCHMMRDRSQSENN
ncbi:hypothetical protein GDO86_007028 [Hymenochirus boettgeri]|uniref:CST complex subunit CTC1 n=1 Tax=Hymenochirus boettgeri TaxID=247094 RepID=A0A8T2JCY2_9PIPI|nr:hypothetical protein GDO86_007028 [Hymenochirus boettgeri]